MYLSSTSCTTYNVPSTFHVCIFHVPHVQPFMYPSLMYVTFQACNFHVQPFMYVCNLSFVCSDMLMQLLKALHYPPTSSSNEFFETKKRTIFELFRCLCSAAAVAACSMVSTFILCKQFSVLESLSLTLSKRLTKRKKLSLLNSCFC